MLSCIDCLVHGQDFQSCWAWWWLLALILFLFKISSQLLKVTSTRSHFSSITHIQCLIIAGPWKSNFSMPLLWHLWRAIPVPEIAVVLAKAFVVTVSQLSIFCPILFLSFPQELILRALASSEFPACKSLSQIYFLEPDLWLIYFYFNVVGCISTILFYAFNIFLLLSSFLSSFRLIKFSNFSFFFILPQFFQNLHTLCPFLVMILDILKGIMNKVYSSLIYLPPS